MIVRKLALHENNIHILPVLETDINTAISHRRSYGHLPFSTLFGRTTVSVIECLPIQSIDILNVKLTLSHTKIIAP